MICWNMGFTSEKMRVKKISDSPGRGGGGGVKKGPIFADVFYGWPLVTIRGFSLQVCSTQKS